MWWKREAKRGAAEGRSAEDKPLAQLRLISEELDRQLSNISVRQANAVTRSSIVLAAAGVTAFSNVSQSLGWSLVPVAFSVMSAGLSLASIHYWTSSATQFRRSFVKPYLGASEYGLLWRQVMDKFEELDAVTADLDRKTNRVQGAVAMLIAAWFTAVIIRFVVDPVLTGQGY